MPFKLNIEKNFETVLKKKKNNNNKKKKKKKEKKERKLKPDVINLLSNSHKHLLNFSHFVYSKNSEFLKIKPFCVVLSGR